MDIRRQSPYPGLCIKMKQLLCAFLLCSLVLGCGGSSGPTTVDVASGDGPKSPVVIEESDGLDASPNGNPLLDEEEVADVIPSLLTSVVTGTAGTSTTVINWNPPWWSYYHPYWNGVAYHYRGRWYEQLYYYYGRYYTVHPSELERQRRAREQAYLEWLRSLAATTTSVTVTTTSGTK